MPDSLSDVLYHPLTAVTALLGVLSQVASIGAIDALWSTVWAQAGVLFSAFSIAGLTLGPQLEFLPEGFLSQLAIVAGLLYLAKLADQFWDGFQSRLDD